MEKQKEYERFNLNVRIQHILLMITFVIQVITGFPLSFPETWWAQAIVKAVGGWEMRMQIHHLSGLAMVFLGVFYIIYVVKIRMSGTKLKMLPQKSDLKDVMKYFKAKLGFGPEPKYDRYSWKEKFEFWGVVWGMLVMSITGFILWFPFEAMSIIPLGWIYFAKLFHFFEALLATLVVFMWHFYNVHFHPEWPLQKQWINGKISEEHMKEHHPIEHEEITKSDSKV